MMDMTVKRKSSNGTHATYRVTLRERTDRTVHDVSLSHGEIGRHGPSFSSTEDLVTFVFDWLLARRTKEDIRSAFTLRDLLAHEPELERELGDLLAHEPELERELNERASDPDAGIRDYLTQQTPAP